MIDLLNSNNEEALQKNEIHKRFEENPFEKCVFVFLTTKIYSS